VRGRGFIPALSQINLNADQRDRIRSLVEQTRQANQFADPETRRQNIARMRAGIWQTLTPEQQAQFRSQFNRPAQPEPSEAPPQP
jgi:Spy/CpxP family protein refolding chaperone